MADAIPLNVLTAQAPQQSPMETVSGIAKLGGELAQSQTLQQTLQAKQQMGQILAVAPSLDDGIHAIVNSRFAAFAPEVVSTLQGLSNAQTAQAGERQTQAKSGLDSIVSGMASLLDNPDPAAFDAMVGERMALLSPTAQAALAKAIPGIKAGIYDGLPKDPSAALSKYQQRIAAMYIGSGFSGDGIRQITGTLAPQITTTTGPEGAQTTSVIGGPAAGTPTTVQPISTGPTLAQGAQLGAEGSIAGDTEKQLAEVSRSMPSTLITLNKILSVMGDMKPGGGADIAATLGKDLQGLQRFGLTGITDDMINQIAGGGPNGLAATQQLSLQLRNFANAQLRNAVAGTGAGRLASEVNGYLQSLDNTSDPATIVGTLNTVKQLLKVEYDKAQGLPEFKQLLASSDSKDPAVKEAKKYGLAGYDAWYNKNRFATDAETDTTPGAPGMDLSPSPVPSGPAPVAPAPAPDDSDGLGVLRKHGLVK